MHGLSAPKTTTVTAWSCTGSSASHVCAKAPILLALTCIEGECDFASFCDYAMTDTCTTMPLSVSLVEIRARAITASYYCR